MTLLFIVTGMLGKIQGLLRRADRVVALWRIELENLQLRVLFNA